jgi:SAM-dependent methyltransferase
VSDSLPQLLAQTITRITSIDSTGGAKLRKFAEQAGGVFEARAEHFFASFQRFLEFRGLSFDYGIDCYLRLCEAMKEERLNFIRNECYSSTSFAEVAERVYHNPDVMRYHMYGLVLGQFLWPDQYHRYSFFCDTLPGYAPHVRNYLEIGGGHALYAAEAFSTLSRDTHIDVVDISAISLELAQGMLPNVPISWHQSDIFNFVPNRRYDFITIGEVLEHLEDPRAMLRRIQDLLAPDGSAYITTPANAPMIDHIYHFNNAQEIRDMFREAGFKIETETSMFAGEMSLAVAEKLKVPLMYAAFVRPS